MPPAALGTSTRSTHASLLQFSHCLADGRVSFSPAKLEGSRAEEVLVSLDDSLFKANASAERLEQIHQLRKQPSP